jgi:hypothetical protein
MDRNKLIWAGLFVGSSIGGYLPSLWDAGLFSMAGVFGSAIGGFLGIYIGYKLGEW